MRLRAGTGAPTADLGRSGSASGPRPQRARTGAFFVRPQTTKMAIAPRRAVRSPLLNINQACQTCHRVSEAELLERAEALQTRTYEMRSRSMDALVELIADLTAAREKGFDEKRLGKAWAMQRRAQFYLDFVEAENSMGFHAPQEAVRILGESIDYSCKGQMELAKQGLHAPEAPVTTASDAP